MAPPRKLVRHSCRPCQVLDQLFLIYCIWTPVRRERSRRALPLLSDTRIGPRRLKEKNIYLAEFSQTCEAL